MSAETTRMEMSVRAMRIRAKTFRGESTFMSRGSQCQCKGSGTRRWGRLRRQLISQERIKTHKSNRMTSILFLLKTKRNKQILTLKATENNKNRAILSKIDNKP